MVVQEYIKTAKNGDFCEKFPGQNDFEDALATFCCYYYSDNASEAGQKIATDKKRSSEMLFECYNLLNSQNILIAVKKGWLFTY